MTKRKTANHKWLCTECGHWIGEDYKECMVCKLGKEKRKKAQKTIKEALSKRDKKWEEQTIGRAPMEDLELEIKIRKTRIKENEARKKQKEILKEAIVKMETE